MKKWFLLSFLLLSVTLHALPLGNPAETYLFSEGILFNPCCCDDINFRAGYYGDYVFDRKLSVRKHVNLGRDLRKTHIYTNAGFLCANFFDRVDVFATLGTTKIDIEADQNSWSESTNVFLQDAFLFLKEGFSWSVGLRGTILRCQCWSLGAEFQYFTAYPTIHKHRNTSDGIDRYLDHRSRFREWQLGAALSYEIQNCSPFFILVPYIGVTWSCARLNSDNFSFVGSGGGPDPTTIFNFISQQHVGFPAGVTILLNQRFAFTLEGRCGSEKAFHLLVQGRF